MRHWPRAALAGGIGFAVSCLSACGGGPGLLSANQASRLQSQLAEVSTAVAAQKCGEAANRGLALGTSIQNLPLTVNPTLRRNLQNGYNTTYQLALKECRQATTATTSTTTASTTSTSTPVTPTTTQTTPTTTQTTPTTTTAPTTPTPTTPTTPTTNTSPSGGGGLGGGNGGGGGGGGGGQGGGP
jgi:uncharacterized protein involved in type VI secretion and phage assembly